MLFRSSDQAVRSRFGSRISSRMAAEAGTLPEDVGSLYACMVDSVIQPGSQVVFTFTVRPTEVLHGAQGAVVAFTGEGIDDDMSNNIADFTVDAAKATTTPVTTTPTATAPASASATPSATASAPATTSAAATTSPAATGALAETGGGDDTSPMLFFGIGAIALGVAAVLLTRRRRTGSHG